jgi:phosphoglycolate phosphatase
MTNPFPPSLQAIVFDFDGTLAETEIDFAEMRQRTVEQIRGWGLWEDGLDQGRYVLEMVEHTAAKLAGQPERRAQYETEAAQVIEDVEMLTCPLAHPFPGTVEALARLRACGFRLGIITRNCRRAVGSVLERYHFPHEVLLTRDDVDRVKPDAAHLLAALERLGVSPHNALMVGDHRTDIECGQAAGAYTCGVLTDRTPREELEAVGANLVVDDVAALAALLCPGAGVAGGSQHGV